MAWRELGLALVVLVAVASCTEDLCNSNYADSGLCSLQNLMLSSREGVYYNLKEFYRRNSEFADEMRGHLEAIRRDLDEIRGSNGDVDEDKDDDDEELNSVEGLDRRVKNIWFSKSKKAAPIPPQRRAKAARHH